MAVLPWLFALFWQLIVVHHRMFCTALPDRQETCPSRCECQSGTAEEESVEQQSEETSSELEDQDVGFSVRCLRGAINDSDFLTLLQTVPTDVRQLEVRGGLSSKPNKLHWSDNLNRLSRLRRLVLVDSGVPALSQAIRLPLLSELVLAGNELEQIQLGSFLGMPMLRLLDLSRNRIASLPTGAFIYLKNLRSLALSHNRLGQGLSTGNLLRGPRQLKSLQLDGNRLNAKQINALFPDIAALERLELNDCGLNDAELWALNLSAVPALERLGLAGNNLTQMPSTQLRALAHLNTLDLRNNLIRTVGPCALCGMNVSRLLMGGNLLGLSARPFNREAFAESWLIELDLGWNHFHRFESSLLAGAQDSLEILHLNGNPLDMDSPLIRTLPRLRELHLADCGIGNIPYSLPKEFQRLTLLNLSANGLDHLPPNLGILLSSLRVLDISHNRFSSLPHTLLGFIDSLHLVHLHHNPWDCKCAAQPLQLHMLQRLTHREMLRFEDTLCAEPALLRGQPLHRVQKINDCAVLFGADFGITQNTELVLILGALLVAAFLFSLVLILLLYCGREDKQKGSYVTGEECQPEKLKPLAIAANGNLGNGQPMRMDLADIPLPPLANSATNSSLLSFQAPSSLLTVHGLAEAPREKQPLLNSTTSSTFDFNQNCAASKGHLVVQSQGPRHPLPMQQTKGSSTLLSF